MAKRCFPVLLVSLSSWAVSGAPQATAQSNVMRLPIFPVPIVSKGQPFPMALSQIGGAVTEGYVLFGIEDRLTDDKEPSVDLNVPPGSTLGDALNQVFRQLPDYEFQVVSDHLIDVYPKSAIHDLNDVLNMHVASFDVVDEHPDLIMEMPEQYIPELRDAIRRRSTGPFEPPSQTSYGSAPVLTLHLRNVTIRQILNDLCEKTEKYPAKYMPFGWIVTYRPDTSSPLGGVYTWRFHGSVPVDWKSQEEAGAKKRQRAGRRSP